VTVLTAVRNGSRYLPEAIASIRSQSFTDWEYIIVDDASEDGTVAIVEAAMAQDGRIRLIRRKEGGSPFVAANEGLRHARGHHVFRLDADDVAASSRIAHQLAFLARNPQLRACAGAGGLLSSRPSPVQHSRSLPTTPGAVRWHLCVRRNLRHSSACVERSALLEIGGYRELPAAQDLRMWCDLSRRRWVGVTAEVVVYSRVHSERLSRTLPDLQRELALDALGDHVAALTGEPWSREEIVTLWDLQRASTTSFRDGMSVLRRWERAWRADDSLGPDDRRHLEGLRRRLIVRLLLLRRPVASVVRASRPFRTD
jgi:glycosyltransferase involved in cell wall biosynthesis